MLIIRNKVADKKDLKGLERDTLVLNWQDRRRSRQRVRTTKGVELGIPLPTGTVMQEGDLLYRDKRCYIVVEAEKEDVIVIYPADMTQGALVAYEIGNRHHPISLSRERIITPYSRLMEEFLKRESIRYECRKEVFEPLRRGGHHG